MIKNVKAIKGNNFDIKRSAADDRQLSYDDQICIGCGICENTCPVSAIEISGVSNSARQYFNTEFSGHRKISENMITTPNNVKVTIDENKCVLCGMCSGLCPADALDLTIGGTSIKEIESYPSYTKSINFDETNCYYCEKCEVACPRNAVTVKRDLPQRADLVIGEIDINKETCINCGICEELCPGDAITVNKEAGSEDIEVDTDKCVYCLVCKRACPVDAIKAACRSCSYGEYELDPEKAVTTGNIIVDENLCINCGWCAGVCPTDVPEVNKPFEGTVQIKEDECGACAACIDVCPCNALYFPPSKESGDMVKTIQVKEEYCIKCGACEKACPNDVLTVKRTEVNTTPTNSKAWNKAIDALKN